MYEKLKKRDEIDRIWRDVQYHQNRIAGLKRRLKLLDPESKPVEKKAKPLA